MSIKVNKDNLYLRTTALRTAGEAFIPQQLNATASQSTISAVQNSIDAHEVASQVHLSVGENLVQSANLISDIGDSFYELDTSAANSFRSGAKIGGS